jgi:hypothetical protein
MSLTEIDPKYIDMKTRINDQINYTTRLGGELNSSGYDIDPGDIRDAMAIAGLELKPISDHNVASYAYFVEDCNMAMDTLIDQLDIEVP